MKISVDTGKLLMSTWETNWPILRHYQMRTELTEGSMTYTDEDTVDWRLYDLYRWGQWVQLIEGSVTYTDEDSEFSWLTALWPIQMRTESSVDWRLYDLYRWGHSWLKALWPIQMRTESSVDWRLYDLYRWGQRVQLTEGSITCTDDLAALPKMKNNKRPGSEGLSVEFFQILFCWHCSLLGALHQWWFCSWNIVGAAASRCCYMYS